MISFYKKKIWSILFIFAHTIFPSKTAVSAPLPEENKSYPYFVIEQKIENALEAFGRNLGLPIKIDKTIKGMVTKFKTTKSRRNYLDELSLRHDFVWYFDGAVIYIVDRNRVTSKTLVLEKRRSGEIVETLKDVGLLEEKFINTGDWYSKAFFVSGPPEYIKRVSNLVKEIDAKMPAQLIIIRGSRQGSGSGSISSGASYPSGVGLPNSDYEAPEPIIPRIDIPAAFESN